MRDDELLSLTVIMAIESTADVSLTVGSVGKSLELHWDSQGTPSCARMLKQLSVE